MIPYSGRFGLRVARVVLAMACLAWYPFTPNAGISSSLVFMIAYAIFSVGTLFENRFDTAPRATVALVIDGTYFAFCKWLVPVDWCSALSFGYLLTSVAALHPPIRVIAVSVSAMVLMAIFTVPGGGLIWVALAASGMAIAFSFHKAYLERRMSNTLRQNVIIRSHAEGARDAERQRIAADFHDGPLQNFVSFQMRLEILKKLMVRDVSLAADELRQLQELCRNQVAELRSFVRSMRPVDEGISLSSSLSRMVEQFQRDTGISAAFSSAEFHDPAETEVSLELLQIVRETLNNIQKHSGASRVAITVGKRGERLEVEAEDNGGGFPFSGTFTLDELELLRMGPASIKRRVKMLGGEMHLESRPGHGSSLKIRVPV